MVRSVHQTEGGKGTRIIGRAFPGYTGRFPTPAPRARGEKKGEGGARPHTTTNRCAPPPRKPHGTANGTRVHTTPRCGTTSGAATWCKTTWCKHPEMQRRVCAGRGGARSPLTAALPSGGAAEHRGELRGHVRGVAEVEAGRRVACGGRLLIRASGEVRAREPKTRAREGDRAAPAPSEHSSVGGACRVGRGGAALAPLPYYTPCRGTHVGPLGRAGRR